MDWFLCAADWSPTAAAPTPDPAPCVLSSRLHPVKEKLTQIGRKEGKLAEAILEMNAETIKSDNYPFPIGKV